MQLLADYMGNEISSKQLVKIIKFINITPLKNKVYRQKREC